MGQAVPQPVLLLRYLHGQIKPSQTQTLPTGEQVRLWDHPADLKMQSLVIMHFPAPLGWILRLDHPQLTKEAYLGTDKITLVNHVSVAGQPDRTVYRVNAGPFAGSLLETWRDKRGVVMMTLSTGARHF